MISNPNKITNVQAARGMIESDSHIFFLYDSRHKWSIRYDNERIDYYLKYFSSIETIDTLAQTAETLATGLYVITYSTLDFNTREATESMSELYRMLQEKVFGIDKALDDIIESDDS